MARVLLQPRGTVRGDVNFRKSVIEGRPLADVLPYVTGPDAEVIRRLPEPIRMWGATPASRDGNDKARALAERGVGDVVFFYADRSFIARARIAHVLDNAGLAESIWGRDEEGHVWQHMILLDNLEYETRPSEPLLEPIGLQPIVRGLTLLSQAESEDFLRAWDRNTLPIDEATEILRELVGVPLETVSGRPNRVMAVEAADVVVWTGRSPAGSPVEIADVQRGLDLLRLQGFVRVRPDELGYRSAFVGAVLRTLPGTEVLGGPPWRVTLAPDAPGGRDELRSGVTDGRAEVTVRLEQERLRRLALAGRDAAECALCGRTYPAGFLVAAHIKRRAACSTEERNDVRNVVMLACVFGCDALFERGYVSVDATGTLVVSESAAARPGPVGDYLARLAGRPCAAFTPMSAAYFDWHLSTLRE